MPVPRRWTTAIVACAGLIVALLAACPPFASASTSQLAPATSQFLGRSEQHQLLRLYAAYRHIPRTDVSEIAPGAIRVARMASTGVEWAAVGFLPSAHASLAALTGFQDGGRYGVFTRTAGGRWRAVGLGGEPLGCGTALPRSIRHLWRLAACPSARSGGLLSPMFSTGTMGALANIASAQVGVSDNPVSQSFSLDCDPYTTLVGNTSVSDASCGSTSNQPYFGSTQDRNEEWCADFTKWVWSTAGVTSGLSALTAGAASFYTWGKNHGESLPTDPGNPQVGDAVVFYPAGSAPNGSYADHVGIITSVNSDGTVNLVNGDFAGGSDISAKSNTEVNLGPWSSSVWSSGEQWIFVSPQLPVAGSGGVSAVVDQINGNLEVYRPAPGSGDLDEDYWKSGKGWSGWATVGSTAITGTPAAVYNPGSGNLEVYATRSSDGALEEYYWNATAGWKSQSLGGDFTGSPSAVYNPVSGNLEVYAKGTGDDLREDYWHSGSGWSGWKSLGGDLTGSPSAVYDPLNKNLEVYAHTSAGTLWEAYWNTASGWHTQDLGGSIAVSPDAVYDPAAGNLEVYAAKPGGAMEEYYWNSANGWKSQSLGGDISGTPSAIYDTLDKNLEVYAQDANGSLDEIYWKSGTGWSAWKSLGGSLTGNPSAVNNPGSGNLEIYAPAGDSVYNAYWNPSTGWHNQNI
jgi:CHAP domain-containing protein/fucose-binding lectin